MPKQCARARIVLSIAVVALIAGSHDEALAQTKVPAASQAKDKPKLGWFNTADLSLVYTHGNTDSNTIGLSNELRYFWPKARFDFDVSVLRSDESDDWFFLVQPGLEFPVGGTPSNPGTSLIKPEPTLDVATYVVRSGYERNISPKFFWNVGGSWERNKDAGIVNRYITYAGVGNNWVDNDRRRFATSYGLSYTDREEEVPDPEKDRRFGGVRLAWDYIEHLNAGTTFDSDLAINFNLSDGSDYSINTLNALTVAITGHVALKVSVQWLFENEPALETDLDVIAFIEVVNPDGIPGTGDERFRTIASGANKLVLGSANARKDKLDTVIRTSLVIKF